MFVRLREQSGNYCLRLKLGDLPAFYLGDERLVIGIGGATLGLVAGAVTASIAARGRANTLRRHLIASRNETDSARKIAQNDVMLAKQFGTTSVFKDLLLTCDNIDRALSASTAKALSSGDNSDAPLSSLHSGIELTRNELLKVSS
jgi:hypothetical protein